MPVDEVEEAESASHCADRRCPDRQRTTIRRAVSEGVRARHRRNGQVGSVTAEFAVALPAVIVVLACCLGAIGVASQQVRLSDAAADAARTLARGDPVAVAASRVRQVAGQAQMTTSSSGDFVCVELTADAGIGPATLVGVRLRASGCALAGGL
jgi:Flp pilus assembly protein TadG